MFFIVSSSILACRIPSPAPNSLEAQVGRWRFEFAKSMDSTSHKRPLDGRRRRDDASNLRRPLA
jgi:hypothetical protein